MLPRPLRRFDRRPALAALVTLAAAAVGTALAGAPDDPAPKLRYAWKPGESYAYSVRVEADEDAFTETLQGTSVYTARAADGDSVTLVHRGHLDSSRRGKGGRPIPRGPSRMGRFSPLTGVGTAGPGQSSEITLDPTGKILKASGSSQLPFVLGNLSHLLLHPLPADGKTTWETSRELAVAEVKSTSPARSEIVRRSAEEKTTYTLGDRSGDTVTIKKRYELKTEEKSGGEPVFLMTGDGRIEFDVKAGLPRALEFKATLQEKSGNTTTRVPVTVTCKLLEGAERDRALNPPKVERKPLTDAELTQVLADLKGGDKRQRQTAAQRLAQAEPKERRADVAQALEPLLAGDDVLTRDAAARALVGWATKENVPALIKAVEHTAPAVRWAALEALGKLRDGQAAEAVAKRLSQGSDRAKARDALLAIGPAAEKAVLPHLKDNDFAVRWEACKILKAIGTKESIPALEEAARDKNALVARTAKEALAAVGERK